MRARAITLIVANWHHERPAGVLFRAHLRVVPENVVCGLAVLQETCLPQKGAARGARPSMGLAIDVLLVVVLGAAGFPSGL